MILVSILDGIFLAGGFSLGPRYIVRFANLSVGELLRYAGLSELMSTFQVITSRVGGGSSTINRHIVVSPTDAYDRSDFRQILRCTLLVCIM